MMAFTPLSSVAEINMFMASSIRLGYTVTPDIRELDEADYCNQLIQIVE
jgi:hypothetical protein